MAATMPTQRSHSSHGSELVPASSEKSVHLPNIRSSDKIVDQTKPLPTSLQSDFIPQDILLAITNTPQGYDKLGPPSRYRNINTTDAHHRKVAASVWNYPGQREKLKHLTKNTPCICGAGRDISFLYDVPKKEEKQEKPDLFDKSAARLDDQDEDVPKKPLSLPDTLIPDEYHVVKNKGVMGLEYHEEKFATHPADHEQHLVQFPSMNPTSRYEVTQLKKTLNEMLDRAGIYEEEVEVKGPTQMHNLLELIKKEQNIYNIVFHELIRQTSVECLERGELLSDLRDKYSTILNKVPRQIKGLHEEVLAQRALDRRLTEELLRFKTTISALTYELANVKEHDEQVTKQATQAQDELKSALGESQKNASLLAEYHELYELQRKRLEKQVDMLAEEREIWNTVAYSLALKVMEEHSLNTAKRLHVSEKSWSKLAHHFTILLSDNDTEVLTSLQAYVDKFRDFVHEFNNNMCQREEDMRLEMKGICTALRSWARDFSKHHLSKHGSMAHPPDMAKVTQLYTDVKAWEMWTMAQESEKFGGDTVLTGVEYMTSIRGQMYGWTDCAAKIFSRHCREDGQEHPDHKDMIILNEEIDQMLTQFNTRLTGENGVATGIIMINNSLEVWTSRLSSQIHGKNPLGDHEWLRFYQLLEEWAVTLEDSLQYIGTTEKEEHRKEMLNHKTVTVAEVMKLTHKWVSSTVNGTDSEDAKLVENVGSLHTEMVKWMVQVLLRLAPDQESHSAEAKEAVLLGSATIAQLQSNAKSLFTRLTSFTRYLTQCCKTIVTDDMQQKLDQRLENADVEYKALGRLGLECNEWVKVARLMLTELTGEVFNEGPMLSMTDMLSDSKPSTADPASRQPSFYDKEKLQAQEPIQEEPAEVTPSEVEETSANQQTEADVLTVEQSEESANQQSESTEAVEAPTPAGQGECLETQGTDQPTDQPDNQPTDQPDNQPTDQPDNQPTDQPGNQSEAQPIDQTEQPPDTDDVVTEADHQDEVEQPEQIEVIGHDANTHRKPLSQSPDVAPPPSLHPIQPTNDSDGVTPPDTSKAYEALAALDSLQMQLLATEERAQGAESKAATLEDQLKVAEERIRGLERQFGVQHQAEVPPEAAAPPPPPNTTAEKQTEKAEPAKLKTKEKSTIGSRSSSRASSKSKKK